MKSLTVSMFLSLLVFGCNNTKDKGEVKSITDENYSLGLVHSYLAASVKENALEFRLCQGNTSNFEDSSCINPFVDAQGSPGYFYGFNLGEDTSIKAKLQAEGVSMAAAALAGGGLLVLVAAPVLAGPLLSVLSSLPAVAAIGAVGYVAGPKIKDGIKNLDVKLWGAQKRTVSKEFESIFIPDAAMTTVDDVKDLLPTIGQVLELSVGNNVDNY